MALSFGEVIINDVTMFRDPLMFGVVSEHNASCIISHLTNNNIQDAHAGPLIDSVGVVKNELLSKAAEFLRSGVDKRKIILDPGIGFGKTETLNRKLLEFASEVPDYQVMIGYSRKRFLGENRMELAPNLEAGRVAIRAGAAFLRVHDVYGHAQLLY